MAPTRLKLVVDNQSKKVLFAEADKDFIDFLFSLLTLPLGSVIKLLSPQVMVGSIGKLYQSVQKLSGTYLLPGKDKSVLLEPKTISCSRSSNPLLLTAGEQESFSPLTDYYICSYCHNKLSTVPGIRCTTCSSKMNQLVTLMQQSEGASQVKAVDGFVCGIVTYMITDDLEVTPMSAISSITLINRFFNSKEKMQLAEKTVTIGMVESRKLLQAALKSATVLTDVFFADEKGKTPSS